MKVILAFFASNLQLICNKSELFVIHILRNNQSNRYMTAQAAQNKVLDLLSEINRPGIDSVIEFIKTSNYLTTAQCHSHHRREHGLMMHSLEVLDTMLGANILSFPRESLIITALFHDLGKATLNGQKIGKGMHPSRSVAILKKCGFRLTPQEYSAIYNHHPGKNPRKLYAAAGNPLQLLLHTGDCISTGTDKGSKSYKFSNI